MRVLRIGFAAAIFLAGPAHAGDGSLLPNAACRAWPRAVTISETGSTAAGGLTGRFEQTLDARSGRYAVERDYGAFTQGEGFDGRLSWSRDRSHASHALDSAPAKAISTTEAWLRRRGWCSAAGARAEALPDEVVAGTVYWVRRVVPRDGIPVLLRFDPTSGQLRQSEIRLWSTRLIRHYEDWRDAGGGIWMSFTERDEYPEDESVETIKITALRISDKAAPAAVFAQPARPHDYAILGGAPSTTVPYEDDGIARIFVPVYVDGNGPFAFELDTGGHLILTKATASQLHLNAVGSFNGTGGGTGIVKQGFVPTSEIRIGAAVMRDQPAKVVPLSEPSNDRGARLPRGGILGLELFERFAVQLDRKMKTMTLTPLESFRGPVRGAALPIHFTEDAPLTAGSFDDIAGDFELDSGDAGPAIVEGYWATQHGLGDRLSHGLVWTGAGVGGEYSEILSRGDFTLGLIKLPHEIISYIGVVERGSESTQLQAGLIGESSLYRFNMTFDYARELVWIDPVPGVPIHAFNRSGLRLKKEIADRIAVVIVLPGSPAEAAGIGVGDQIVSINRKSVSTMSVTDASLLLSGQIGTDVVLGVIQKNGTTAREVTLQLKELLP